MTPTTSAFLCTCVEPSCRAHVCTSCGGTVVPPSSARALAALRSAGKRGLTSAEFEAAGVAYGAARVDDLRGLGYSITSEPIGSRRSIRRYVLVYELPQRRRSTSGGSSAEAIMSLESGATTAGEAPGADEMRLFEEPAAPASTAGRARGPYDDVEVA